VRLLRESLGGLRRSRRVGMNAPNPATFQMLPLWRCCSGSRIRVGDVHTPTVMAPPGILEGSRNQREAMNATPTCDVSDVPATMFVRDQGLPRIELASSADPLTTWFLCR
jgi:hypothetical protein